eukprot:11422169-Alexandrium_andersonii.AAC.1
MQGWGNMLRSSSWDCWCGGRKLSRGSSGSWRRAKGRTASVARKMFRSCCAGWLRCGVTARADPGEL